MVKEIVHCLTCINPESIGVTNSTTGEVMKFYDTGIGLRCEICEQAAQEMPDREFFNQELDDFFSSNRKILYAYSGGLDSTAVLVKLADDCQKRGIELKLFTIDTGAKGKMADENIKNVISYLQLEQNHRLIDISNEVQDSPQVLAVTEKPMSTLAVYAKCRQKGILPCGTICNSIMDAQYKTIMKAEEMTVLITGGDTPKLNAEGKYSLFWKKPSGITILRGGYAYAQTKQGNFDFIQEKGVPWKNPNCGGYDTDCLIPGVFFAEGFDHKANQDPEVVIKKYPIILEYLAERTMFGVFDREEALRKLSQVEIASSESYREMIAKFDSLD